MTSNAVVGTVYAWAGRRERARANFALLYAGLGEPGQAFQWLRRAYDERSFLLIWVNLATWYDGIRDD